MKKIAFLLIIIIGYACAQNKATEDSRNVYARNNIESYTVTNGDSAIRVVEFDRNGNIIKQVSPDISYANTYGEKDSLLKETILTDSDGKMFSRTVTEYKANQMIETHYDYMNLEGNKVIHYRNREGKDTLVTCHTKDNQLVYKTVCIYDEIGLRERTSYNSEDTIFEKRVNNDKLYQIFETTNVAGELLCKEIYTYNEKGDEIEFFYEGFTMPGKRNISHYKKSYLDNGLIDKMVYYDEANNPNSVEMYGYKTF